MLGYVKIEISLYTTLKDRLRHFFSFPARYHEKILNLKTPVAKTKNESLCMLYFPLHIKSIPNSAKCTEGNKCKVKVQNYLKITYFSFGAIILIM